MCAGPSTVGRRGRHRRKGHGDAPRAAPRLRWGAAAPAENRCQRNDMGGPGVLRTPGRRPPHRNGGARRLSGYAAKSRSDAPTGGAMSEPVPLFPAAVQAAIAKGLGLCLSSIQSRKNNDESRSWQKDGRRAKPDNQATRPRPLGPIKRKCSAGSAGGSGVTRRVRAAGRPVRPILATRAAERGAGLTAGCGVPQRKGYGDVRCAPARLRWAGAVGAHKDGRATIPCGGSRGPADPWSAAAASKRRDLWFFQS